MLSPFFRKIWDQDRVSRNLGGIPLALLISIFAWVNFTAPISSEGCEVLQAVSQVPHQVSANPGLRAEQFMQAMVKA